MVNPPHADHYYCACNSCSTQHHLSVDRRGPQISRLAPDAIHPAPTDTTGFHTRGQSERLARAVFFLSPPSFLRGDIVSSHPNPSPSATRQALPILHSVSTSAGRRAALGVLFGDAVELRQHNGDWARCARSCGGRKGARRPSRALRPCPSCCWHAGCSRGCWPRRPPAVAPPAYGNSDDVWARFAWQNQEERKE